MTTDKPLPWCPCPSAEDVHQESCPHYQELLRREQAWRDGAHRWELMRARMPGRFTTVAVRMPGDLVDVTCDGHAHAQWLAALLHSWGVPKSALTIHTAIEEPTR